MDRYDLIFFGRVISLPFLILTFFHYRLTSKFGVLHKKCIMNYLVLLMITNLYILLLIAQNYQKRDHPKFTEHIYDFISMSTILWISVLCYDFWQKIKNLMPYNDGKGETRMYIKCSIYVWSCSFLHSIVSLINDYFLLLHWIHRSIEITLFIIICIVILFNLLMMLHATILIIKEMQLIKNLRGADYYRKDHKQKLRMYFKLIGGTILLMVNNYFWFTLSNLLGQDQYSNSTIRTVFNYVAIVNSYQGLFIFLIFTLKKKNVSAFKKKVSDLFTEETIHSDTQLGMHENT